MPNTLLSEIAEKTYYGKDFEDCALLISNKLLTQDKEYNRIYKVFTLVEYLLKHRFNICCDGLMQYGQTIRILQEFRFNYSGKKDRKLRKG